LSIDDSDLESLLWIDYGVWEKERKLFQSSRSCIFGFFKRADAAGFADGIPVKSNALKRFIQVDYDGFQELSLLRRF
jgi:hypothetical protein